MTAKNKRQRRKSLQVGVPTHSINSKKNKGKSKTINCNDCVYYVHPKHCSKNNTDLMIAGISMARKCNSFEIKDSSKWKLKHQIKSKSKSTGKHGKVVIRQMTDEEKKKYL